MSDFDIRSIVKASEVAKKYMLGPNAALLKAVDIAIGRLDEVMTAISRSDHEFVLIDIPGQIDLFIFRDISPKLIKNLLSLPAE
ncbi:MAG: hypothetical protein DRO12_01790 [Thermoprotei archaeon]|nr:MAG: hypothetical protein DRO12_01790 [Thermoprotei archaeon]